MSGQDAISAGLGRVGQALVGLSEDQRQREEALQVAEADAELTTRLTDARRRFETDPDWRTFQPRFEEEANRIVSEAGNRITNPRVRERWLPRAGVAVSNSFDHVRGRQNRLRGEHEYERLDRVLGELGNTYTTAPDDATREDVRRRIEETLELGRRTGVVSGERIRDLTRRHLHGSIEADALGRRDSYAALLELREGDERARQPSTGQLSELGIARLERERTRPPGETAPQTAAANRRLRTEAARISEWISGNFRTEDGQPLSLTQLQHDALVGLAMRSGQHWQDTLGELIPLARTGNWGSVSGAVRAGGLTLQEAPTTGGAPPPTTDRAPPGTLDLTGEADPLLPFLRRTEGFRSRPYSDHRQTSIGYGTRAREGETSITREEAERRLVEEVANARRLVRERFGANLTPGQESALTDLTYNAGPGWMDQGLGRAVEAGNWTEAQRLFRQYINASGQPNEGLRTRREALVGYLAPDAGGLPGAGAPPPTTTAPPTDPRREETADMLIGQGPASRYARLPPERRRVLIRNLSEALRPELMAEMESDLERIRQTGEPTRLPDGTTHFSRAARVLTPNQFARYRLRLEEAYGQYRALRGLQDMTPDEVERHLNSIAPGRDGEGEYLHIRQRNYNLAATAVERMREEGRRDAARSVEVGLTLRGIGTRTRTVVGADGATTTTGETDIDHRLQPAREVREAHLLVRRLFGEDLTFASDTNGNLVITPREGRPLAGQALQRAWGLIIEARLAAQVRRGITEEYRSPITRTEAADLLRLPRNMGEVSQTDFDRLMREAVRRAEERYGSYARMALDAAVGHLVRNEERNETARSIFGRMITGQPITRQDLERAAGVDRINAEERAWLGTRDPARDVIGIPGVTVGGGGGGAFGRGEVGLYTPRGGAGIVGVDSTSRLFAPDRRPTAEIQPPPRTTERVVSPGLTVSQRRPSPERINHLMRYPHLWREFNIDFGDGAAAEYLRQLPLP